MLDNDERPTCPKCGCPARVVVILKARARCELLSTDEIGKVISVSRSNQDILEYECGFKHVWKSQTWIETDESWTYDNGDNVISKGTIVEIDGPGIPLYNLTLTVDHVDFRYKKPFKSLAEAKKVGKNWLQGAQGASLIMTDFRKV